MPQSPSTLIRRRRTARPRTAARHQERYQARAAALSQEEAPPEVLAEEALEPESPWAEAYDDEPCETFESPERPSPERGRQRPTSTHRSSFISERRAGCRC